MDLFDLNVKIFKWWGFWNPFTAEENSTSKIIYNVYSYFWKFVVCSICLEKFLYLSKANFHSLDDVSSRLFLFPAMISSSSKFFNVSVKQDKIILITKILKDKYCLPVTRAEIQRQLFFNQKCKEVVKLFSGVVGLLITYLIMRPVLHGFDENGLPLEGCHCFELSTSWRFWSVYAHQSSFLALTLFMTVAHESLYSGLLVQMCAQADHLKTRLANLSNVKLEVDQFECLKRFVKQHIRLYKLADMTQDVFGTVVFIQIVDITISISINMYYISKYGMETPQFYLLMSYFTSSIVIVFFYNWHGNEVIVSTTAIHDAIDEMDWSKFGVKTRLLLLQVIVHIGRPVAMTIGTVSTLSLNTFTKIVKSCYGSFNMLRQSTNNI